jgi:hypothetical protein
MSDTDRPGQHETQTLSRMLDLEAVGGELWSPAELGAILAHQLAAPLECDLGGLDPRIGERLRQWNAPGGPPLRTFSDALRHKHPPLELLELIHRFAKNCRQNADGPVPQEIATVLYFASIVAALVRCGRRITALDDDALRRSVDWALQQPWLDADTRALFAAV